MMDAVIHVCGFFLDQQVFIMERDWSLRYVACSALTRTSFAWNHVVIGRFAYSIRVDLKVLSSRVIWAGFGRFPRFHLIQIYRGGTDTNVFCWLQCFHAYKFVRGAGPTQGRWLSDCLSFLKMDYFAQITWINWFHFDSFCFNHLLGNQLSHLLQITCTLIFRWRLTLLFLNFVTRYLVLALISCWRRSTWTGWSSRWCVDRILLNNLWLLSPFMLFFLY